VTQNQDLRPDSRLTLCALGAPDAWGPPGAEYYFCSYEITIKDHETIPNQRMILNSLGRARYRSKIDLSDAYFHTRVEPKDVDQNDFKSPFGCFVSKVMLQGDMKTPGPFMPIMSDLFAE